ncbi:MAG TPA: SMP-30/gluconolactonase/LRE family protein, partial [Xanthomonadales bacterium]|nr:SMP-30/gluconolactonase/LRE family protein [Xanthomonadales bacterium]
NSVASMRDGTLLATIPLFPGIEIPDALDGRNTGAVFRWSPGDSGFIEIEGTGLPYANGIELSEDEQEFYVASSGLFTVTAYSNTNPARKLRQTVELDILPDNLHWDADGLLVTGGLNRADTGCGTVDHSNEFSLEEFAACPRPFTILTVDPQTMEVKTLASGPANANFSNITMAVTVGNELWIGTFAGDRLAYTALAPDD